MSNSNFNENDEESFIKKVKTLKDVSIDLTEILKRQNKELNGFEPSFISTLDKLKLNMKQLSRLKMNQIRGFFFYFSVSLFFLFLLFLFCTIF